MTVETDVNVILRQEEERCRAITEQDWDALDRVLADDMTHTHMNGRVEDKPTYLANIKNRPRAVERSGLSVRVYGDTAVMNGRMINRPEGSGDPVEAEVIQVWVRHGAEWKEAAFQASRVQQ